MNLLGLTVACGIIDKTYSGVIYVIVTNQNIFAVTYDLSLPCAQLKCTHDMDEARMFNCDDCVDDDGNETGEDVIGFCSNSWLHNFDYTRGKSGFGSNDAVIATQQETKN